MLFFKLPNNSSTRRPSVGGGLEVPASCLEASGDYLHELTTFPKGKYDDQADSTSQALDWFKNHSAREDLGLIEYLKTEGEKIMAAQKAATVPESMQSPRCNGVAKWPPAGTQQRVQFPTRTDILNGVKFGRF
jgi:hypothetical protein